MDSAYTRSNVDRQYTRLGGVICSLAFCRCKVRVQARWRDLLMLRFADMPMAC
jgi:hypothetical protein